ncbi:MAG: DMT family transporter [Acidibacillus sp.]|uniref:Amino-acid metabolite efflux pump n=1 Tax=Sulfoacidibacillus ferrooxidans TaxID=2005001 RepID=A0A9X1V7T9_9BACL|nr:DMT family transporter [Sulfoacidibacillus ferrooxidans]MCI0182584.1 putative amino-acid metabolite efflux pump [Sulfoacidibacillus ferrooxidans]MCY0894144.1 DMT family transporter [Acidibacillus sp.]
MKELSPRRSTLLLIALITMWGMSWPIYKIALSYTPPILFGGMRTFIGGVLMAAVIFPRYREIRLKQMWRIYLISALFNTFLFYGLQTVGLWYVPEGLFTVIVYLQPVLIGVLAWLWLGERLTVQKMIGLLLGFAGVTVISITGLSGHISAIGIVLALGSAISWAIGTVYVKKVGNQVDAFWLVAIQCIIGGLAMTAIGLGTEHWSSIIWNQQYLTGLMYGSIFGIPISWAVFYTLVRAGDVSKVASFTFLVPLLAVVLGFLFLHEEVTISLLFGLVFIATSIYLVNRTSKTSLSTGERKEFGA